MLQRKGESEYDVDLNEEDAEDTIVCSTSSTSVNRKVQIENVTQLEVDNEEELTGSAEEVDDDKDEDFEVSNGESDEEDGGIEGDDESEVEGKLKERRLGGSRKKSRGDTRKQDKRSIGISSKGFYLSVHRACVNVNKHGRKVSQTKKTVEREASNKLYTEKSY